MQSDVLGDHWNRNRPPLPPSGDGEDVDISSLPDSSTATTLRDYKKHPEWKPVIELAQDYVLGHILLEHGFPQPAELKTIAGECVGEARSVHPSLNPDSQLGHGFGNWHDFIAPSTELTSAHSFSTSFNIYTNRKLSILVISLAKSHSLPAH